MTNLELPPDLLARIESSDRLFGLTPEEIVMLRRWQQYYPMPAIPKLPHAVGGFHFNKQMLPPQSVPLIADRLPKGWGLPRLMAVHRRIDDLISFTELSLRAGIVPAPAAPGASNQESEGESPACRDSVLAGLTAGELDALRWHRIAAEEMVGGGESPTDRAVWEHLQAQGVDVGSAAGFLKALTRARRKIRQFRSDGSPRSAAPISHFNRADD